MGRGRDFRGPQKRGFDEGGAEPRWPDQAPPSGGGYGGGFGGGGGFDRAPSRAAAAPSGPERDATVKWFNKEKGFGFVELADGSGDAFLHIRAVEAAGHADLLPGTRLTVHTAQGQKGPQVTDVTSVDTSTAEAAPMRDARPPRTGGFGGGDRFGGDRGGYGAPAGGGDRYGSAGGGDRGGGRFASGPSTEMSGTVKWYDPAKGFGFVSVNDGGKDVFVHRSALSRAGLESLAEGQQVVLGVVEGQKGREAQSINVDD
ncbi:cold-shock protein [Methylobacterium sp. Leaf469]|jgi:CspA family cold shock protein|uniref:cold-shock protein n=1 Tax=unclassified Methylobacterium TaxID=2615210 RepID=UPI0006FA5D96|nr:MULTISPECIES: cold-shock protein [unclassified Methylobacterium]KQO61917.1 cold-shock protein [Methylobacterium sp. Leaf87]KQP34059.1 cold-shock protein [Methylobacterium sp. Leaf102]KQP36455.1 cold-shock protein [Methylobacterium sp. Leaf100]KQP61955.1 cold-shock protein [Methylobacterium sp. Leaf112]KQU05180.1 cold-shock protein [Methylobacterium sp. Leaf469]